MTRRFTGWHMATIMIAFFGVVIAVNVVMASSAVRTFGGVVVDNSYVASQRFNGWLAEARAQDRLGWRVEAREASDGTLALALRDANGPIDGALVAVDAQHPLGRLPGRAFTLIGLGAGRYEGRHALQHGRWQLQIQVRAQGHDARFAQEVRL